MSEVAQELEQQRDFCFLYSFLRLSLCGLRSRSVSSSRLFVVSRLLGVGLQLDFRSRLALSHCTWEFLSDFETRIRQKQSV